ncbi:MAG: DUF4124 domain-containing protein [Gammaproteobacteria bacterium]|nr:DUF4124 domain-containing protein [Gammaproteobacteria bacterium]
MGLRKYLYLVATIGITFAGSAAAGGIARWVDENGVTHFGNPQFAPAGEGSLIEIAAINIMDVPVAPPRAQPGAHHHEWSRSSGRPSATNAVGRDIIRALDPGTVLADAAVDNAQLRQPSGHQAGRRM